MISQARKTKALPIAVAVTLVAVLAVAGTGWIWTSTHAKSYVFTPCPGLTITSTATTGIWNCPNQPVTGPNTTLTSGQFVSITGTWARGYGTLGCVPQSGQASCAVPQIASLQDYLHTSIGGGMWFVVQWQQGETFQLMDGQTVTVSGTLREITYSSNAGATFPIYHLNNQTSGADLLQPQPRFEITNAVLG